MFAVLLVLLLLTACAMHTQISSAVRHFGMPALTAANANTSSRIGLQCAAFAIKGLYVKCKCIKSRIGLQCAAFAIKGLYVKCKCIKSRIGLQCAAFANVGLYFVQLVYKLVPLSSKSHCSGIFKLLGLYSSVQPHPISRKFFGVQTPPDFPQIFWGFISY